MKYQAYEHKLEEINLRMHQVRRLKELRLAKGVLNTEALMLILDKKFKTSKGDRMVFKYLDAQEDLELMRRKETKLAVLNHSPYKEQEQLVIPEFIVNVDSSPSGFAMPLIEDHKNLGILLHSSRIPFSRKKEYLKQLGMILDRASRVDSPYKLIFADLNAFNFIIDRKKQLRAVDLDSSIIEGLEEERTIAYYLQKNGNIANIPEKYRVLEDGSIIATQNSDLYCYCMIILETLANIPIHQLDLDSYFAYLEYLKRIGIDSELIDIFYHLYTPKENQNPLSLIESIPDKIKEKADYKVFEKKYL